MPNAIRLVRRTCRPMDLPAADVSPDRDMRRQAPAGAQLPAALGHAAAWLPRASSLLALDLVGVVAGASSPRCA